MTDETRQQITEALDSAWATWGDRVANSWKCAHPYTWLRALLAENAQLRADRDSWQGQALMHGDTAVRIAADRDRIKDAEIVANDEVVRLRDFAVSLKADRDRLAGLVETAFRAGYFSDERAGQDWQAFKQREGL